MKDSLSCGVIRPSYQRIVAGVVGAPVLLLATLIGYAQPLEIEEIIVTSTKRETNLSDTAVSASVFGSDKLADLQITNGTDYEALVPSLSFRQGPGARVFIRGIGRVSNALGVDPGVAVYNDGVYSPEAALLSAGSLNQQRVEILRGPQGTLFGRNAAGGTFSSFSKRPTQELDAAVRVSVGNYDNQNYQALVRGPINEAMGYKLFVRHQEREGFFDNVGSGEDGGASNLDVYEGQFQWNLNSQWEFWLKYSTTRFDGQSQPETLLDSYSAVNDSTIVVQAQADLVNSGVDNPGVFNEREYRADDIARARVRNNDAWITHLTWNRIGAQFKYIGGYSRSDFTSIGADADGTDNPSRRRVNDLGQFSRLYSHELQLTSTTDGPLQYVAGLYIYHEENDQPFILRSLTEENLLLGEPGIIRVNPETPNTGLFFAQRGVLETDSYSAYGELSYRFNPRWQLTTGLRFSVDKKEGFEIQERRLDPQVFDSSLTSAPALNINLNPNFRDNSVLDEDFKNLSGRVVVNYTPAAGGLIYGSISSGYKSGGFRLGSLQANPIFDEETVLAYEAGWKGSYFDRSLRFSASAYWYDYADNQVLRSFTSEDMRLEVVENVDVDIYGVELEAFYLFSKNLSFIGAYSYIDSQFKTDKLFEDRNFPEGTLDPDSGELADVVDGNPAQQSPRNKLSLIVNYQIPSKVGRFSISPVVSYVGARNFDIFDNRETRADSYVRVDLQGRWVNQARNFVVRLQGRNLADKDIVNNLSGNSIQQRFQRLAAPRTYALELEYRF